MDTLDSMIKQELEDEEYEEAQALLEDITSQASQAILTELLAMGIDTEEVFLRISEKFHEDCLFMMYKNFPSIENSVYAWTDDLLQSPQLKHLTGKIH